MQKKTVLVAVSVFAAGAMLCAPSVTNAITITSGLSSVDFDPSTATLNNWVVDGVGDQIGTGIVLSGFGPLSFNSSSTNQVTYTFGTDGFLTLGIVGVPGQSNIIGSISQGDPLASLSIANDFTLGGVAGGTFNSNVSPFPQTNYWGTNGAWSMLETVSGGGADPFGPLDPNAVGINNFQSSSALITYDLAQIPAPFMTFDIQINQRQAPQTAIPEPMTSMLGLAGLAGLAVRLTGRKAK